MGYILDIDTIASISSQLKKQGKKIVFTHGAFDLFHCGHLEFLTESRKQGDILIVGVESDANIRKYKSVIRPILPQRERVELVSNHMNVDFAFVNEDGLDLEYYVVLYEFLFPSLITYGRDFSLSTHYDTRLKNIQHKRIVLKRDLYLSNSTTAIIKRIQGIPQN